MSEKRESQPAKVQGPDEQTYVFDRHSSIYKPMRARRPRFFSLGLNRDFFTLYLPNIIQLATLLVVSVYTYFAFEQVNASEGANDAARKALRESQRPLTLTLEKMDANTMQASRFAKAAEAANANAVSADRPWIGSAIVVSDFEAGKVPKVTCTLTNSGRRPAVVQLFQCSGHIYPVFPAKPEFGDVLLNSHMVVVPGATISNFGMTLYADQPNSKFVEPGGRATAALLQAFDARATIQFVYLRAEYTDARTGERHATHACVQYIPAIEGTPRGFYNCSSYNDGD